MFSPLKTLGMIYLKKRPFILNHKVNIACDCRCRFCNSWQIEERPESLMALDEIKSMLDQAAAVGMLSYSAWGGEPLLREDTHEIMSHARKRGFFTALSTNGSLLADRADEFIPHTSLFLISLDGIEKTHDKVRGFPGLFDRVVKGIELLRGRGATVRLFYNVNMMTLEDVAGAAKLAKELSVSIFYFPVVKFPGYNDQITLDRDTEAQVFGRIIGLKREGYPVLNLNSYLRVVRDGSGIKCHFPGYHIYVDYDGTAYTCDLGPDRKLAVWGDVREADLSALFKSEEFRAKARELINCNACRLNCGELGSGSPLLQFPVRALTRLQHEWLFQRK
jgi:MoaA/NifB/PqqE/SkfB family radical SAM enzyme